MLDRKFIVDNADAIIENCRLRGVNVDVLRLVELETQRREALQLVETYNRQANEVSQSIGQAKDAAEREARKADGRRLRQLKEQAQLDHDQLDQHVAAIQLMIPNMTHPAVPRGADDQANVELGRSRQQPQPFHFPALDHVQLAERWGWIDFEAGARTTGAGFYFLKGEIVMLDLALQRLAVERLAARGYQPTITPDLARDEILQGIGFMPRGPETQVYSIENADLSLIGTAEITLGGLYAGQTLTEDDLPIRLCGISHCYRTEAGAAGRATRGLYRVHQFTKVEMFALSLPQDSEAIHQEILDIQCELFDALEIPYRIVDTATGDLGGPAYRKFDLEAWMPGRGEAGEWGEVTSTSNCTDYQSRRLAIRYKRKGEKGTHLVHTLNGTAFATGRAMIALLENFQQADGTVAVPDVLRPYLGRSVLGGGDAASAIGPR
jgi:seryl-tRNA synthetase